MGVRHGRLWLGVTHCFNMFVLVVPVSRAVSEQGMGFTVSLRPRAPKRPPLFGVTG